MSHNLENSITSIYDKICKKIKINQEPINLITNGIINMQTTLDYLTYNSNAVSSDVSTNASVNANSYQAQVDCSTATSNESTEPEINTNYSQNNKKCKCTSFRTCKYCKSLRKQSIKNQREINRKETLLMNEKIQEELGRKALEKLGTSDSSKVINAYRQTEQLINVSAQKYAQRYGQNHPSADITSLFYLYKILLFPENAIIQFVKAEDSQIIKQVYKTYAKHIHPDKNTHPQAKTAFQKLTKYWHQH